MRIGIFVSVVSASMLLVTGAMAQDKDVKASDTKDGYGYDFKDDPLAAGGFGPNDATIRVRPGPVRQTLIRPRTSFVPEMLKSVENL
ncbi:MAG: hypothetical protein U0174_28145 [Polyangiaceae bacterium]